MEGQNYLTWMLSALGPVYALLLPLSGFAVFVGACVVVAQSRRPAVIAAYLVFLLLPVLIGVFSSLDGFISGFGVIARGGATPKASEIASGISMGLFTSLVGLLVTFPSYFVFAFGLFIRTVQAGKSDTQPPISANVMD